MTREENQASLKSNGPFFLAQISEVGGVDFTICCLYPLTVWGSVEGELHRAGY